MIFLFIILNFISFIAKPFEIPLSILSEEYVNSLFIVQSDIQHDGRNSSISIVSDGQYTYILKQIKKDDFFNQLSLIKEVIVSAIGSAEGVNLDKNAFIPFFIGNHIKVYKNRAATLHQFIDGKSLNECNSDFIDKKFKLSQRFRPYEYEYKYGFTTKLGLNIDVLKSMACHKHLPPIIAIDTFFGNFDRDFDNVFYNQVTNTIYGIDQGAAFSGDLPYIQIFTYHQLLKLYAQDYFSQCSLDVLQGLDCYKKTLSSLCIKYQASDIIFCFEKLIPLLHQDQDKNAYYYMKQLRAYLEQSSKVCFDIVDILQNILL